MIAVLNYGLNELEVDKTTHKDCVIGDSCGIVPRQMNYKETFTRQVP